MIRVRAAVLAALLLAGCATTTGYYQRLDGLVVAGRYADAAALSEAERDAAYGSRADLLYHLDRALLLHYAGSYQESAQQFEAAKRVVSELFTKSVTAEASTLLVNDGMRPYPGEDFERAQINVFAALNYALLGRDDDALVEARQLDHFFRVRVADDIRSAYQDDGFARYLMGMLYENRRQFNDAYISYRKALAFYDGFGRRAGLPAPPGLAGDALRLAQQLGFRDQAREMGARPGIKPSSELGDGMGEIVVLCYAGFVARKTETVFEVAFGKAWGYVNATAPANDEAADLDRARAVARSILADEQVRVALPVFTRVPSRAAGFSAVVSSAVCAGYEVQDLNILAETTLDERIARVRIRAIARAAVKFALGRVVSSQVEQNSGSDALAWLAKKAVAVAGAATERADRRSWRSLPGTIFIARQVVPAGAYEPEVTVTDASGAVVARVRAGPVTVRAGRRSFAAVRAAV